ncbi:helix-turn-helix domain-containing protein [Persicobacter psychrovividus]|uniref:HTH araC/xylS-type domain-containing protein n=1 Tax=Persicobacter psychrovividus TaxID=387638 RepID=A0ABN6LBJ4_9BACT|nr:hypothetical protein PEPS_28730 [Persicobacter psychrovividus]
MTTIFFIWSSVQSLITGLLVLFIKKSKLNWTLAATFFVSAINIYHQYLFRFTEAKFTMSRFIALPDLFDFALPALIFLYVKSYLGKNSPKDKDYLYFAPAAIFLASAVAYVLSFEHFTFNNYIRSTFHSVVLIALVFWKGYIFTQLSYLIKEVKQAIPEKQQQQLDWPKILHYFVGVILYTAIVQAIFLLVIMEHWSYEVINDIRVIFNLNYIIFNSSLIIVSLFFVIKYPKILAGKLSIKQASNPLSVAMSSSLQRKIDKLFNVDKIHTNTELNEVKLAEELGIQKYMLSKYLNDQVGVTFNELLNQKRVEEAQRIFKESIDEEVKNFGVAIDSGFKTESVFYVNFKKITGMTPNQYKKQLRDEREGVKA